jgi:tRNA(His) 5'-end guanylyltransferase
MSIKDSLGDRMKDYYENRYRFYLTRRIPAIIRLDMKAGHTFCRGLVKPYDLIMLESMKSTTLALCEEIQGVKVAYTQSDEISLLVMDDDDRTTQAWFDKNLQKIVSVSASIATLAFNKAFRKQYEIYDLHCSLLEEELKYRDLLKRKLDSALFDSRVFSIPKEEIVNYFIWRQQDASRNSVEAYAHANFSQKSIQGLNNSALQEKLFSEKEINWNNIPTINKRGFCAKKVEKEITTDKGAAKRMKWEIDTEIPIFTSSKDYIFIV